MDNKFGPEYKRQKYLESKQKKAETDTNILNSINNLIELCKKRKECNGDFDLVLKNFSNVCCDYKQLLSTAKYCDDLNDETIRFDTIKNVRIKMNKEKENLTEEIIELCKILNEKRQKIEKTKYIHIILCENENIYIEVSEKAQEEILNEESICSLISPKKKFLGIFKGNEEEAILFVKYLKLKKSSLIVIYGKNGKMNDIEYKDKSEEEIYDLLTNIPEKKTKGKKK